MADQKINALPTKTAPVTGDKCLMSGAAEEYLIDYDKLATAILNKLTSKTFTLDQGTKTLIAAINELNSKSKISYILSGGEVVPRDSDMNNFKTPGNYACAQDADVATLKNAPFVNAFTLKVELANGSDYPCQTYREYNTGTVAYRYYNPYGSTGWTSYTYFKGSASS